MDIDERLTNLVYQDFNGAKGGSNSSSKLEAIRLPDLTGKRFLDLGCNAGFFCAHAMEKGASYTLGVDISERVIGLARERYPDLEFRSGGWDKFPEGEFDTVICLSAIHYAKDPAKLAQNIRNCLSDTGVFVLEGGLFGVNKTVRTDTLIPVWREVGDKCRHLSTGYLARHLLRGFNYTLLGPSVNQGGDPLDRYVVHASRKNGDVPQRPVHEVSMKEFVGAVGLSAPTIHDQQPSAVYVRQLDSSGAPVSAETVEGILADTRLRDLLLADLEYALVQPGMVNLVRDIGDAALVIIQDHLSSRGFSVTVDGA